MKKQIFLIIGISVIFSILLITSIDINPNSKLGTLSIKNESKWNIIQQTGNEQNLTLWTSGTGKKIEIGFLVKSGMTYNTIDKCLYYSNNQPILDDKNKPICLKYETAKCGGLNCYHISLTDAQAVNIDSYIKLGNSTIILTFQETKTLEYINDFSDSNITLYEDVSGEWINTIPEIFVFSYENSYKFGANHSGMNESEVRSFKYAINSNVKIYENGLTPYLLKQTKGTGINPEINNEYYVFDFSDICNKDLSNYSSSPECIFNQINDTYLEVTFNSDKFVDPTINIQESSIFNGDSLVVNITNEANFSHLTLIGDTSNQWRGFNYTARATNLPYFAGDDNNSYLALDGVNDFVNASNQSSLSISGNLTISAWVYPKSTANQGIVSKYITGSNNRMYRFELASSTLRPYIILSPDGINFVQNNSIITAVYPNQWNHVAVNWVQGTNQTYYYVNGVLTDTRTTAVASIYQGNAEFDIGVGFNSASLPFNGSIDNVLIWNRSLTSTEISSLYNLTRKDTSYTDTNLVSAWRFDNTNLSNAHDSTETNNGTFKNGASYGYDALGLMAYYPFDVQEVATVNKTYDYSLNNYDGTLSNATFNSNCIYGGCYNFTGNNRNKITFTVDYVNIKEVTICTWIYPVGWGGSANGHILSNAKTEFRIDDTSANAGRVYLVSAGSTTPGLITTSNDAISLNNWYHICVTRNESGHGGIYLNGVLNGSANQFSGTPVSVGNTLLLGTATSTSNREFNGSIDEVMIFNNVLNSSQILDIYNNQSVRFKSSGTQTIKQFNMTLNSDFLQVTENKQTNLGTSIKKRIGSWNITLGYNNTDLNSSINGLVSYWHLDESSWNGTTGEVKDAMGRNNGTAQNATGRANTTSDAIFYRAGNLDLNTDYLNFTSSGVSNNTGAISIWFKSSGSLPNDIYLITVGNNAYNSNQISIDTDENVLDMHLRNSGTDFKTSITKPSGNVWHHFVGIWNLTTVSIYLDGVLGNSATGTNPNTGVNNVIIIGAYANTGSFNFNGSIDEVMIFNRSLTADEVKELYIKGRTNFTYSNYQTTDYFTVGKARTNFLLDYLFNSSVTTTTINMCYQETANVSTSCGGVATGNYVCSAGWDSTNTCSNVYDGNWGTNGSTDVILGGHVYLYVNYTKPSGALSTSLWQVKDDNSESPNTFNLTINSSCWNYSSTLLSFRVESYQIEASLNEHTKILTTNGEKNIKDLKIGDFVLSYNERLKTVEFDKIINVFSRHISSDKNKYYYVYYGDKLIKATYNHKFYVNGEYVLAENLKIGDMLLDNNLKKKQIIKIEVVNNSEDYVWDLNIENNHNFFANNILVHNDLSSKGEEWTCYNGTWVIMRTSNGTIDNAQVYEEAMNWNISLTNTYNFYSPILGSGVGSNNVSIINTFNLTDCGNIGNSGEYLLINNVNTTGTCFTFLTNDINFNGNGYTVNYNTGTGSNKNGIYFSGAKNNITINNTVINLNNGTSTAGDESGAISLDFDTGVMSNISIINNNLTCIMSLSSDFGCIEIGNWDTNVGSIEDSIIKNNKINYSGSFGAITFQWNRNAINSNISNNNILTSNDMFYSYNGKAHNNLFFIDQSIFKYTMIAGNITLENSTFGKISLIGATSTSGTNLIGNLTSDIRIGNNSVFVSPSGFKKPSNITLYNIPIMATPTVLRDGAYCSSSICSGLSNISSNYSFDVTGWSINYSLFDLADDLTAPTINLTNPLNNSYKNSNQNFTANLTDNYALKNATLYIYNSTNSQVNNTFFNSINEAVSSVIGVVVSLIDGIYKWFYEVFDIAGNKATSTNFTVTMDTINPLISYGDGTAVNFANLSQSNIYINVTFTELNFANITFNLRNSTWDNVTTYSTAVYSINVTNLSDGKYWYFVNITDKANNKNSTGIYNITLDTTIPIINITYPVNGTTYNELQTQLNYTLIETNAYKCWYSNNSGINNYSIQNAGLNFTVTTYDGNNNLTVYCNDTANNIGNKTVFFTIVLDNVAPSLTINYPTNGSSYGFNGPINLTLNITANDTNGISIMWYNVDNGNNVTFTNITGISLSVLEGTTNSYTINVYVNDTYNNINATTLSISVSQLNPPGMGGVVRSYIKPQNMTNLSVFPEQTQIFQIEEKACNIKNINNLRNCIIKFLDSSYKNWVVFIILICAAVIVTEHFNVGISKYILFIKDRDKENKKKEGE